MMQGKFAKILLFAFMLPACAQAQQPSAANGSGASQQGDVSAGCDNNLASAPGQGKEYDFFKNMAASARGCTSPSPVAYQKFESQKADARLTPSGSAPSRQEEFDRAACRSEGENAAKAARGLQPGEYDIFKSIAATRSDEAEKGEQSCMAQRGYKKVLN